MPFPFIFSFYSYKGGVGRSLALLNVAYRLVSRGRHVLMVDLDIEAPGISGFLARQGELNTPAGAHPKDILTLLAEGISCVRDGLTSQETAARIPPVSTFARSIKAEKLATLKPKFGKTGRLDVVVADDDRDYCRRLSELGLQGLPPDKLMVLSSALHFYFKQQQFIHHPIGLEWMDSGVKTKYDYILVDSRTGISEIGGLCVGPLADRLIVVTGLNEQNVFGTLAFLKEAGVEPKQRAPKSEKWDEADSISGDDVAPTLGPKPTLVVATPVPNGEIAFRNSRLNELEKQIGIRPLRLSYHPQMALIESLFVRDYPDEYLAIEYNQLAHRIMASVQDTAAQLNLVDLLTKNEISADKASAILRIAGSDQSVGSTLLSQAAFAFRPITDEDHMLQVRIWATLAESGGKIRPAALHNWGNTLSSWAEKRSGTDADRLFTLATQKFEALLEFKSDDYDAFFNWGNTLSAWAKKKGKEDADKLYELAGKKFEVATIGMADKQEALNNWGNTLSDRATHHEGEKADSLFKLAVEKFDAALKIKPDKHETLFNWACALSDWANKKADQEAERLYELAGRKFEEALKIKPDHHEALNSWGSVLSKWAGKRSGVEANELYDLAGQKFESALKIKPDKHEALNNWGYALAAWAREDTSNADNLFQLADQKFEAALKIKPGICEALTNWGNALADWATTKTGVVADKLYKLASQKFQTALEISPQETEALYNWGCTLSDWATKKKGAEASQLYELAGQKFEAAIKTRPDHHKALNNWGGALAARAKIEKGANSDKLYELAIQKFDDAFRIRPDKDETLHNQGVALLDWANEKDEETSKMLYERAIEKFSAALKIKPNDYATLYILGSTLIALARKQKGVDAERTYRLAGEQFGIIIQSRPEDQNALLNWGLALAGQARVRNGIAGHHLREIAAQKFEASHKINPDNYHALNSWGTVLLELAKDHKGESSDQLLEEARQKLYKAEQMKSGCAAYNLACLEALRNNAEEAVKWLQIARTCDSSTSIEVIDSDSDFDSIRERDVFKAFYTSIKK